MINVPRISKDRPDSPKSFQHSSPIQKTVPVRKHFPESWIWANIENELVLLSCIFGSFMCTSVCECLIRLTKMFIKSKGNTLTLIPSGVHTSGVLFGIRLNRRARARRSISDIIYCCQSTCRSTKDSKGVSRDLDLGSDRWQRVGSLLMFFFYPVSVL
jgi:hypothetical protein